MISPSFVQEHELRTGYIYDEQFTKKKRGSTGSEGNDYIKTIRSGDI